MKNGVDGVRVDERDRGRENTRGNPNWGKFGFPQHLRARKKKDRERKTRENRHPDKGTNLKGRSTKQDQKHMGVAGPMGRPHFQGVVLGDRSTERLKSLPTAGTAPKTQVANKSKHKT